MRCVHGLPFDKVPLCNDPARGVERAWCVHCDKEHTQFSWWAQCCYDTIEKQYLPANLVSNASYCILCDGCYVQFRVYREQLCKVDYRKDFDFGPNIKIDSDSD